MARHRKKRKEKNEKVIESEQRTGWILGIAYSGKTQRGLMAEKAISEALDYHRQQKTIFPGGRTITHIEQTLHFSPDDIKGIDVFVTFQSNEVLPVQVRNWWSRKSEEVLRRNGVCLVVIWLSHRQNRVKDKSPEQIKNEARENVFAALWRWYKPYFVKKGC